MASPVRLSIAIPTYNREAVLVQTLDAIIGMMDRAGMELLVIDQTAAHEVATRGRLENLAADKRIRLIHLEQPSLTRARNCALAEARGEVVLFLDDDVILPPHFLRQHLDAFADPSVAAVTGQIYNCNDPFHPPPLSNPRQNTRRHSDVDHVCDANNISGGNHSVRRHMARAVGGYDERFVGAALAEDLDFARRIMKAGHRIKYDPDAWIIHLRYPSGGCGVSGIRLWPEWTHSASLWLYAFRHSLHQGNFLHFVWMAFRNGPGRREIALRPWRWPAGWWGFIRGLAYGWKYRRRPQNSFPGEGVHA